MTFKNWLTLFRNCSKVLKLLADSGQFRTKMVTGGSTDQKKKTPSEGAMVSWWYQGQKFSRNFKEVSYSKNSSTEVIENSESCCTEFKSKFCAVHMSISFPLFQFVLKFLFFAGYFRTNELFIRCNDWSKKIWRTPSKLGRSSARQRL